MAKYKKQVLFIIGNLESGGVSKSVVSTLYAFDYSRFDVDLLVMGGSLGVFGQYIPKEVNIIFNTQITNALSGFNGVKSFIKEGQILLGVLSLLRMMLSLISKSTSGQLLSRLFPSMEKVYDAIIDYNGQHQLYYMVDKLHAKKKITFFHSDYNKWPFYKKTDKKYFPKVDAIFTVSDICVQSLKENFPDVSEKVRLFENISSPSVINKMSDEPVKRDKLRDVVLVTVGHVSRLKGIDYAIDAASILKEKGLDFTWLFIGCIIENNWVEVIRERGLQDNVKFLGVLPNPYPYMKKADIIVHPSRFEGKSIALDEAKILCKPIVVTDFSTVQDQFDNGVNGSICHMSGASVAGSIMDLINDVNKRERYIQYLKRHVVDNSNEVEKLYALID